MNWKYLTIIAIVLISCKKIDKLTNFYFDISQEITFYTGDEPGSTIDVWTFNVLENRDTLYKENNSNVYGTNRIAISKMKLSSSDTLDNNMEYIESIEVFITANDMQEKKIAWLDKLPEEIKTSISLDFSDDDLKDYIVDKDYAKNIRIINKSTINIKASIDFSYTIYINSNLEN